MKKRFLILTALTLTLFSMTACGINTSIFNKDSDTDETETVEDNKNYLRFDIIDDGEGILPENLPYIWDRYYKENRAHKRAGVGTGLGLSIVKKIIEQHNGIYGVISEPGKGSDFYIMLSLQK